MDFFIFYFIFWLEYAIEQAVKLPVIKDDIADVTSLEHHTTAGIKSLYAWNQLPGSKF